MKKPKVVLYSVIALAFMVLTFAVDWLFIIPAAIILFINKRELMKK